MADNDLVLITAPILDWAGVKLDPAVYAPGDYYVTPPSGDSPPYVTCAPHRGNWTLPIAWREDSYWMYWDRLSGYHSRHNEGDWHMPVPLYRDMSALRRARDASLAQAARMNVALGESSLDLEAIKQRHLSGDVQRTLYEGHVLVDLALVIEELERYRVAPAAPPAEETPAQPDESDKKHYEIPF